MTILVTTYGATGNGTTDDTAAINAAIAAAKEGDIVEFPGPTITYKITGPINVNKRIKLTGGGSKLKSTTGNAINITAEGAIVEGLVLEGSRIAGQIGVRLGAGNVTLTDCSITLYDTGIEVWGGTWHRIEKIRLRNIVTTVVKITNIVGTVLDDVRYDTDTATYPQPTDGILLNGEGCAFTNLDFIHAGNALHIAGAAIHSPHWNFFSACSFDTSRIGCLIESWVSGASVNGIMFEQCWFSSHTEAGVQVQGNQTLDGLTFNGCHLINNGKATIAVSGSANNIDIRGCTFSGNSVQSPNGFPNIYFNIAGKKMIRGCTFSAWGGLTPRVTLDVLRDTADGPCVLSDNYGDNGVYSATPVAAQIGFNFGTSWPTR